MDFTPELSALQGVLISTDNVYSFSQLSAKGGNEEKIHYVTSSLFKFLGDLGFIREADIVQERLPEMRKFAMFLVLNGDLPVLEEMVEKEGIDVVIWTVPTIPKCLMCEMFWSLHMEQFVYEIIAFSYPQLSLEVACAFLDNIKYFNPTESLEKLKLISSAYYRLICRLHFFKLDNNIMSNMLTVLYNNFQKCITYFVTPPNAGKLERLTKDEQYKYKGNCLYKVLLLVLECITQFISSQEFSPNGFDDIYLLTYKVGSYEEDPLGFTMNNSVNKTILDCLDKCNLALLDKCKELVMEVSVDIFCAWSEFEKDGKNMQETVGEMCYKLRNQILNIENIAEHPLASMIQQISRKPVELEDVINATDSDTILKNISGVNKIQWLQALINKKNLCSDYVLVHHLACNLEVLSSDACHKLFKTCNAYLSTSLETSHNVKSLAIKAFHLCNTDTKNEILDEQFKDNNFCDMAETEEFNEMLTDIFNRLSESVNVDISDVLTVFLQSPQNVFIKIFNLATENSQQTLIMLKVMEMLSRFSNHYYRHDTEPCIIRIIQSVLDDSVNTENAQRNFIQFICGLKTANIIPGTKLILLIVMPRLHKALLNKDISAINIQCHLLSEAFTLEELVAYRAPMLAMYAQVLDAVRWKIDSYVPACPQTLQLALDLQIALFGTYTSTIPEKEASWLKSKLRHVQPLNIYYYKKLWDPPGANFIETVSGMSINHQTNTERLSVWLSQVLCSATLKEWCDVWDSLVVLGDADALDLIHDSLSLLTAAEIANRVNNSWVCLLHCFKNFVYIVRYKFFKEPLTNDQVLEVISKIAATANLIKEANMEEIKVIILPLFSYMVEKRQDYNVDVSNCLNDLLNIKNSDFVDVVNKIFSNNTMSEIQVE